MENLLTILMQPAEGGKGSLTTFIPLILLIVVFYFFLIRPQMKRQKELKNFRESLQKGDKVVTTGGIYGRILSIEETTFLIEVDDNVKLRIDKNAVLKDPSDLTQNR